MRLFIAVNLPGKERQRIYRASSRLRDQGLPVGWIDPENYHLTLKFLGQVRADRIPAIEAALRKVAADNGPFPISLGGFGAFPTVRRPRVLWLGVDATP
ncbi:MAG: RNA 2',3'-cyclic phosphodiesterase, partial [Gemmatimonadota bacterium]|nr:RNA 2',3'-cyclic phosphodiesterase [Gemmatimonadota bacterium]